MDKKKKALVKVIVGLICALLAYGILMILVGAVMFCHAVVTNTVPTAMEKIGMIFVLLFAGGIAAIGA